MSGCHRVLLSQFDEGWSGCRLEADHEGPHGNPPHWTFDDDDKRASWSCITAFCGSLSYRQNARCDSCEAARDEVAAGLANILGLDPETATMENCEERIVALVEGRPSGRAAGAEGR